VIEIVQLPLQPFVGERVVPLQLLDQWGGFSTWSDAASVREKEGKTVALSHLSQ